MASVSVLYRYTVYKPPVASLFPCEKVVARTIWLCANSCSSPPVQASHSRAEKSAEPVAQSSAGGLSTQDQTAPCRYRMNDHRCFYASFSCILLLDKDPTLCPANVPYQSPDSPCRSIGCPSLLALARKYPSGVILLQVRDAKTVQVKISEQRQPTTQQQAHSQQSQPNISFPPVCNLHDRSRVAVAHDGHTTCSHLKLVLPPLAVSLYSSVLRRSM
jgi:hypothetical protein